MADDDTAAPGRTRRRTPSLCSLENDIHPGTSSSRDRGLRGVGFISVTPESTEVTKVLRYPGGFA